MKPVFFSLPAVRILAFTAPHGTGTVQADTYTWDGGSAHDDWGDAFNWTTNQAPVSSLDTDLVFAGTTRLSPNQNVTNPFVLNALSFDGSASFSNAQTDIP